MRDDQETRVREKGSSYQSLLQVLHRVPGHSDYKQREANAVVPVREST
jgi:hypothetical protein